MKNLESVAKFLSEMFWASSGCRFWGPVGHRDLGFRVEARALTEPIERQVYL